MKLTILLLVLSVVFISSCTTAYKTGQTPDDVYYSPAKQQEEYVEAEKKEEYRQYSYTDDYYDDRYLRMKVRNRYRWSDLDSWYGYDRYSIGYNYTYGSFNNPFNTWSYYYNPYCCCLNNYNYVYINPKTPVSQPVVKRHFSLAGYTNTGYNNSNNNAAIKTPGRKNTTTSSYNNSNNGLSNKVRTIFSNDNSGSGSSRTYNPSSSSSSGNNNNSSSSGSSGNSGGSGGAVKRPTRN